MKLVKQSLGEPDEYSGVNAYDLCMHCLEGEACHRICLDWLAEKQHLLPEWTWPAWPEKQHNSERRWQNVLHAALSGFQEFVTQYEVEAVGVEQEVFSKLLGLVGHVDLPCSLKWKRSRIKAVCDLKFVASLMESHRLQVRCYGRMDQLRDYQIGLLFHGNRTTGKWAIEPVDLRSNLDDVAAVANAARLWAWAESKKA